MCGIVGYIGKQKPKDILLNCLKKLEYRGYDSAGIALLNKNDIQIIKSVGKIKNLEEKINKEKLIDSSIGIAHTRWATHGKVNEINAHPHTYKNITIVHNGIIENASTLKKELINEGYKFTSETDSEVIAALLYKYYENDMVKTLNKVTKLLKGSYALAIMIKGENKLYGIKKDSPLVIGIGKEEYFIASDILALSNYVKEYILLENNEIVCLTDKLTIAKENKQITKEILKLDIEDENIDNNNYEHFMLKEIMEEPTLVEKLLKEKIDFPDLSKYKEIHIVGCGSAFYAGLIAKNLFEEYSNIKVMCELASEYRYKKVFYDDKTLVILISQSGETADTIAALRKAKDAKADTLAIVNVKTSTIARESDKQLFIEAGAEIAVATTKAFILQVLMLSLLSLHNSKYKDDKKIKEEINKLPLMLENILKDRKTYLDIAKKIYKENNIIFIGRKIDYSICLEGSLKLKEVSYIHSEAYQAGELKHGTISLINKGFYVFGIVTDDSIRDKTIANIEEVKTRGASIIFISNKDNSNYEDKIIVKEINPFIQSLLVVPTLQLIAYETAKLRDCEIDKPKNLAKSVTVE